MHITDYAELRAALKSYDPDDTSTWAGFWNHVTLPTIRTLLAERDALLYFTESFVEAWEEGVGGDSSIYRQAKAALAQNQGV